MAKGDGEPTKLDLSDDTIAGLGRAFAAAVGGGGAGRGGFGRTWQQFAGGGVPGVTAPPGLPGGYGYAPGALGAAGGAFAGGMPGPFPFSRGMPSPVVPPPAARSGMLGAAFGGYLPAPAPWLAGRMGGGLAGVGGGGASGIAGPPGSGGGAGALRVEVVGAAEGHLKTIAGLLGRMAGGGGSGITGSGGGAGSPTSIGGLLGSAAAVPAYDRPIPVIVVGPRPLPVSGGGGSGGPAKPTPTPDPDKEKGGRDWGRVFHGFGFHGAGAGMGRAKQFGGAMGELGMKGMGGMVGKAAPAIGAGIAAVDFAAQATETWSDPYTTDNQKWRSLVRMDPTGIGGKVQGWADAFSGRKAGMIRNDAAHQRHVLEQQVHTQRETMGIHQGPGLAGAEERAKWFQPGGAITLQHMSRKTAADETEYKLAMRMLPVKREMHKAEREHAAAIKERAEAQSKVNSIDGEYAKHDEARRQAEWALKQDKSGVERDADVKKRDEALAAMEHLRGRRETASGVLAVSAAKERDTKMGVARMRSQYAEAEAETLETRADIAAGGARRMGMMDPAQRAQNKALADRLAAMTPEQFANTPAHIKQMGAAHAPEFFGKFAEEAGQTTKEFKGSQGRYAADFGRTGDVPEKLREKAQELRRTAAQGEYGDEMETAKDAVDQLKRVVATLLKGFDEIARLIPEKVDQGFMKARSNY